MYSAKTVPSPISERHTYITPDRRDVGCVVVPNDRIDAVCYVGRQRPANVYQRSGVA